MKKYFFALLVLCNILSYAQNKITGTVTFGNQKLHNAIVSLPEVHIETLTNHNGEYTLNNVPKGKHNLVVTYIGFETVHKEVEIQSANTILDIVMVEKPHQMDEVIVSTAFNKLQSQNVMKVEHQKIKSFRERGALTLTDGLSTIPGVNQISTGTSIGKPVIRGLSGNRVLVYSQGVRLENQQFGEEHGLGLNDAGIESVEVIKGPSSLLYGSDALGGVLYFNPEKFAPVGTQKINLGGTYFSNTLGTNSTLGYKLSDENLKFLARVSKNVHSDYKVFDGNRVTNTRFNDLDFKSALNYSNTHFSSTFRYNYNKLNIGIPEADIEVQTTDKTPDYPKQKVINHIASLNTMIYFKNSKLESDLGYIKNQRNEFEDSEIPVLNMDLRTFNYNIKYYLPKINRVETILGVQGMSQDNKNLGEERLIPDASTKDVGVFFTSNYEWNKNSLQAGIRYDKRAINSQEFGEPNTEGYFTPIERKFNSFNSSLGYKTFIKQKFVIRCNVASGFRAPNLAELTSNGVHEGSNRYEIGNKDLKNEQNLQIDTNFEYRNPHFELFVNGFYNAVNNYIYLQPNGQIIDDNSVFDYVQSDAYLYGGEAGIHFHPHPLDWLHITTTFETVTGKSKNGTYLPLIPANKLSNVLKVDFKDSKYLKQNFVSCNVDYFFKQNKTGIFETQTSDYTLLNVALGSQLNIGKTTFDCYVNANNLLNKNYIAHLSRLKTDGIPNIGRNIILGVNFNF